MPDAPDSFAVKKHSTHPGEHQVPRHAADSTTHTSDAGPKTPADPVREAYEKAQHAYQQEVGQYWQGVDKAKHSHQKVTSFPPFYKGPEKPPNFDPPKTPGTLPSIDDMLHAWRNFAPLAAGSKNAPAFAIDEPAESDFKKGYAREALNIGARYGLNKSDTQNIVQSIYAFEDGGRGTADMLSGVPMRLCAPDAPGSHANSDARRSIHPLSTAIGYNQMLMATTLRFVDATTAVNKRLAELEQSEPSRAKIISEKIKVLDAVQKTVHSELLDFAKTDRSKYLDAHGQPNYTLYADFARSSVPTASGLTGRQVTSAVQALNLDRDIGPVLQAQELNEIVEHGLRPTFKDSLKQKTADDADEAQAYDHFSFKDKSDAVKQLIDRVAPLPAADPHNSNNVLVQSSSSTDTSAREILQHALLLYSKNDQTPLTPASLGQAAYDLLNNKIVGFKKYGDISGPLSPAARALVDKISYQQMKGPTEAGYLPAAVELANLAGGVSADAMLKQENSSYPTTNFFDQSGYQANGITNGRTADELVKAIYRNMHGSNGSPTNYGMSEMIKAFDSQ